MKQNNISIWKYDDSLDCMLFFAQRVDELLFHYTTDSYRIPSLSLCGLANEFCTVYRDASKGIINSKNLKYIVDEFNYTLQKDPVAKSILSREYTDRFNKYYGSWDLRTQYENVNYIRRRLGNFAYYHAVVDNLKILITKNKEKKAIDNLSALWVREVIDCGYNENYIYWVLHATFFRSQVSSIASLEYFFEKFDFNVHAFDVYIGFSNDMLTIKKLFDKMHVQDIKISMLSVADIPSGIQTRHQKTILKFEGIKTLDLYSAYEIAYEISTCVADSYAFFRHDPNLVRIRGQVVCEDKSVVNIKSKHLLKYRVSILSAIESERNADLLLKALFSNSSNRSNLRKIIRIHNSAIGSENINDSLLSLWSLLEALVDQCANKATRAESEEVPKKENTSRSNIENVTEFLIPFLKSSYIQKLVLTFAEDVKHWDIDFFNKYISANGFGKNDAEHTFAFIVFETTQDAKNILYKSTQTYPLLKNRLNVLHDQLCDSRKIKAIISEYEQRVKWNLHRIYRARNYIVHDASGDERLNRELLINLHSYIDTLVSKIIELLIASPYNDSLSDIILEHKLEISIFDEKLEKQEKEDVTEKNALKYLYYDYKK